MNRVFFTIGLCWAAAAAMGCLGSRLTGLALICVLLAVFLLLTFTSLRVKSGKYRLISITAAIALAWGLGVDALYYRPLQRLQSGGESVKITGEVLDVSIANSVIWYQLEVKGLPGEPFSVTVNAVSYDRENTGEAGDHLTGELTLFEEKSAARQNQLRGERIAAQGTLSNIEFIQTEHNGLKAWLALLRKKLAWNIRNLLPGEEGSLTSALAVGERELSEEMTDHFRRAGVSHLLALSGLHVSMVFSLLLWLLERFRLSKRWKILLAAALMWGYVLLTGAGYSVLRAGIMATVMAGGLLFSRQYEPLNAWGLALTLLLIGNPYAVFSLSFLYSFAASLGILVGAKPLSNGILGIFPKHRESSWAKAFSSLAAVNLCGLLSTLPITLLLEENPSVLSPVATMVVAPFVPVVMIGGMLLGWLGNLPLLSSLAGIVGLVAQGMYLLVRLFSAFPYALLPAGYGFVRVWLGACGVTGFLYWKMGGRRLILYLLSACLTLNCGIFLWKLSVRNTTRFLIPAQGDMLVVARNQTWCLAGQPQTESDARQLLRFLQSYGVKQLEIAFFGDDITSGGAYLLERIPVDKVAAGSGEAGAYSFYRRYGCEPLLLEGITCSFGDELLFTAERSGDFWALRCESEGASVLCLLGGTEGGKTALLEKSTFFLVPEKKVSNISAVPAEYPVVKESTNAYNRRQASGFHAPLWQGERELELWCKDEAFRVIGAL